MKIESIETRGRTLDYAAFLYDLLDPIALFKKRAEYDRMIVSVLELRASDRVLDLGCGTGMLTRMIADHLRVEAGGYCLGIDAAGKMVQVAIKRRQGPTCRFQAAAAEDLPFADGSFDAVVSSLLFHHLPYDLKRRALDEAFRVLRGGGKLVIADMHVPTTRMGAFLSHASRWFFLQPQIGENIRGVLPGLIQSAGFSPPRLISTTLGFIAIFAGEKPDREGPIL